MLEQIQNKHILIDGDIVKYRCAASAEKSKYLVQLFYGDGRTEYHYAEYHKEADQVSDDHNADEGEGLSFIWSRKEVQPVEFALQACKTTIESLIAKLAPSRVSIFLSPERNFRNDIARTKPYKGNRTQPKPKYLKEVEEYLIREHGAKVCDNIEADDEIGISLSQYPERSVSVSIDKDLLQISGWHYNWVNDRVQWISPRVADFNFYTQMLTGDITDNIPGLPGYGPKTAKEVLSGARSRGELASRVWSSYRGIFTDADECINYYLEQANLLWIRRYNQSYYQCPIEFK